MPQDLTQPIASSSKLVHPAADTKLAAPPGRRVVASRFLNDVNKKPTVSSPRRTGAKRSFITHVGKSDTKNGEWIDDATDAKGKGRAGSSSAVQGGSYVVPSRFMLPPPAVIRTSNSTSSRPPTRLSSSTSTSATRPPATASSTAGRPPKLRSGPPPSRPPTVTRPVKVKLEQVQQGLPPPSSSFGSSATKTTVRPMAGSASGRGASRAGKSTIGRGREREKTVSSDATVRGEGRKEVEKRSSWLGLAQSLGSSPIPSSPSSMASPLHAQAQALFLLLANMQLTAVSDDSIMTGTTILKNGQAALAKAEEDVKEDVERERLTKKIELMDSLLDPKVGHKLIPLMFDLHQADGTYDQLLTLVASEDPPPHYASLPVIKDLNTQFAGALVRLNTIPRGTGTPLAAVLDQKTAQTKDKLAVLDQVKIVVEGRRDKLREELWAESVELGRNLGSSGSGRI